jgi:hypothetical protein
MYVRASASAGGWGGGSPLVVHRGQDAECGSFRWRRDASVLENFCCFVGCLLRDMSTWDSRFLTSPVPVLGPQGRLIILGHGADLGGVDSGHVSRLRAR